LYISPSGYCEAINRGSVNYGSGGAQRVTFAIAEQYGISPVTSVTCVKSGGRYVYEWSTWAQAGESGFARPGVASGPTINKFSPTGSFTVTDAFGLGNPGTALNYVTLNAYSRWGGRLNANYNKYFESSADIFPDENMWYYATRPSHDYRQGVVINYNRPPDSGITMDAGFAIFLHANRYPSWGCIAMNEPDVVRFMTTAVPGDRIVMGVVADVFR
jgi:L,D-peptidoglycan transpeptidase YkuD (ErfK/YbiS/YcfS/YnhG family)